MNPLYSPLRLRNLEIPNRWMMAPMCQYSAEDGRAGSWHLTHYAERARGGVGLVIVEATAVEARGRISPGDLGLWRDDQAEALAPVAAAIRASGARSAVQLAHAGRKASARIPWTGSGAVPEAEGGWPVVGPSALAFSPEYALPRALDPADLEALVEAFAAAARRALAAGFDTVEIHAAHGYLLHQFLSPLTNQRTDAWGGSLENRCRLTVEVVRAVRRVLPATTPLLIRLSATDWVEGGWDLDQTTALVRLLKDEGVDFVDVSSGGLVPHARVPVAPLYQVPLAAALRQATGLPVGAVGLITEASQAEAILAAGEADAVLLGRLLLRDPTYPLRSAPTEVRRIPLPYLRAY